MEDSRIVELYWQKNADTIKETDSKYGAYCFAIADSILQNKEDSEECVNDTWLNENSVKSSPAIFPLTVSMHALPKSVEAVSSSSSWTSWRSALPVNRM